MGILRLWLFWRRGPVCVWPIRAASGSFRSLWAFCLRGSPTKVVHIQLFAACIVRLLNVRAYFIGILAAVVTLVWPNVILIWSCVASRVLVLLLVTAQSAVQVLAPFLTKSATHAHCGRTSCKFAWLFEVSIDHPTPFKSRNFPTIASPVYRTLVRLLCCADNMVSHISRENGWKLQSVLVPCSALVGPPHYKTPAL